ncbi:glutamate--cysteine ligase [Marivibrio halodurans]|uniref:Glutamate--cysteine ligase n=1 Tax=Marivibrio halodurans TaxID=2039722 RepID=A0A8J7S195_9PROT|nr:glutamate--cysteine ligase [Marivibrio halodurans]MBP5858497.1 glutamate--cysteine ligase [Marivibrio halodurans]
MSGPSATDSTPVESKQQLIDYLASGSKPRDQWRIGTEHEKFAYEEASLRPLPYASGGEGPDIEKLLRAMAGPNWEPVEEAGKIIALKGTDGGSVTLEPGGQLELSGAPLETIHQTCSEVHRHLDQVRRATEAIGAGVVGLGFNPIWRRDEIPWMPKGRYKIMRDYMPKKGNLGLDMMTRTCTVQVNLDFEDERDMIAKMRVGLALQPLATALFANSPFTEGKPNGFLSYRSHIWTDTDPDRCGMLPFVFDDDFGFERWVDYVLDVPMYFFMRDGVFRDASGLSFRDFMAGKLPGYEGDTPTMSDWADHLTTVFPEIRLKKFIEMRGADGGPWGNLCALPAFWVGLLYEEKALARAQALIADWSVAEIEALRDQVPRTALKTPFRGGTLNDVAKDVLDIARDGLRDRARISPGNQLDERQYIEPLRSIVASGSTFAEDLLEAYETRWKGDITEIYEECRY